MITKLKCKDFRSKNKTRRENHCLSIFPRENSFSQIIIQRVVVLATYSIVSNQL